MTDRIEQLLGNILREMVDSPEEIRIRRYEDDNKIVYYIFTKEGEQGLVIGKGGILANSIREIIKAIARKLHGKFVYIDVVKSRLTESFEPVKPV